MGIGPMVTTTARAVLTFADTYGNKGRFSVPRARLSKTGPEAQESMNGIIATGALELHGIEAVKEPKSAMLVRTTRTQIA